MAMPILPSSVTDPTGQDRRERGAIAEFNRRFKQINKGAQAILAAIPVTKKTLSVNVRGLSFALNAESLTRYEFQVDTIQMELIGEEIDRLVDQWIEVRGDASEQWLNSGYVGPAYQQGTAMTFANLSAQSGQYKASRQSLTELIKTPEYRRRIGFVRGRVFEEMKGLSASVKTGLRNALSDGIAQGLNPLEVARNIDEATRVGEVRARRIARTEITTALRRARLDEAEQASGDLGLGMRMMQMSALSSTTRPSHAARHSKLYTFEQARVWMATSPNMINCKCSFVEVLVDANGKPLTPKIVSLAFAQKAKNGW